MEVLSVIEQKHVLWGQNFVPTDKWIVYRRNCSAIFRHAVKNSSTPTKFLPGSGASCFSNFSRDIISFLRNTGFYNIRWCLSTCWVLVCLILFFIKSKDLHIIGFPQGFHTHLWLAAPIGTQHPDKGGFAFSFFFFETTFEGLHKVTGLLHFWQ